MNDLELIYKQFSLFEAQGAKIELVHTEEPMLRLVIPPDTNTYYVAAGPVMEDGMRGYIELNSPEYHSIYSVDGVLIEDLPDRVSYHLDDHPELDYPEPLVREVVYKKDLQQPEDEKLAPEMQPF